MSHLTVTPGQLLLIFGLFLCGTGLELLDKEIKKLFFWESESSRCGDFLKPEADTPTGSINSPNYPNDYNDLDHCIWLLQAPSNYSINIVISPFKGQVAEDGSCLDFMEIRDGSRDSELKYETCDSPYAQSVTSTNRWMWVRFKASDNFTNSGFTGTYSIVYTGDPSDTCPIPNCRGANFRCRNQECTHYPYRCDGMNDCGCVGGGCDEDNCDPLPWSTAEKFFSGVGIGTLIFSVVFFGVGFIEFYTRRKQRLENLKQRELEEKAKRRPRPRHKKMSIMTNGSTTPRLEDSKSSTSLSITPAGTTPQLTPRPTPQVTPRPTPQPSPKL